jgi:hypothetical protein
MTTQRRLLAILIVATTFASALPALAATVTVSWDPTPGEDVGGYVVHYGTTPGDYSVSIDVGRQTSWRTSDLPTSTWPSSTTRSRPW